MVHNDPLGGTGWAYLCERCLAGTTITNQYYDVNMAPANTTLMTKYSDVDIVPASHVQFQMTGQYHSHDHI